MKIWGQFDSNHRFDCLFLRRCLFKKVDENYLDIGTFIQNTGLSVFTFL